MDYYLKDATITNIDQLSAYDGWGDKCVETTFYFDRQVNGKRTYVDIQSLNMSRVIAYFIRNVNTLHETTVEQFIEDMKGFIE